MVSNPKNQHRRGPCGHLPTSAAAKTDDRLIKR